MVRIPSPYFAQNRIESSDERHESRFHGTERSQVSRFSRFGDGLRARKNVVFVFVVCVIV